VAVEKLTAKSACVVKLGNSAVAEQHLPFARPKLAIRTTKECQSDEKNGRTGEPEHPGNELRRGISMETHGEAIFLVEESLARISGDKFMQAFVASFSSDPAAWARTALRVVHFCGLVLGVGAATLLDLVIARFVLLRGISREHVQVIDFSSKVVTVGLGLLWFSGIGFLIHYGLFDPPKLWNPKIWAKITIVFVLSINGVFVHHFVLPHVRARIGKRLLDGVSYSRCSLLLLAGAVSAISWYVPLLLGAIPQLNFVVPAGVILGGYALILIAAAAAIRGAIFVFFEYSGAISISSDRGRLNLWRATLAVGLFLMGAPVLTSMATSGFSGVTSHGELAVNALRHSTPANKSPELNSSTGAAFVQPNLARLDESGKSHVGRLTESAVTAVWQSEGKLTERTVLVNSLGEASQVVSDYTEIMQPGGSGVAARPSASADPSRESMGRQLQPTAGYAGFWAADPSTCRSVSKKESDLLTVVDERGARAGESYCRFNKKRQIGDSEWEMKATCGDGTAQWESNVRLAVSKNRLRWSGSRGSQTYVRCTAGIPS